MTWINDNQGFQQWKSGVDQWWDDEHQAVVYGDSDGPNPWRSVHLGVDGSVHIYPDHDGSTNWFGRVLSRGDRS